jgi:hypothetical protein
MIEPDVPTKSTGAALDHHKAEIRRRIDARKSPKFRHAGTYTPPRSTSCPIELEDLAEVAET